MNLDLTEAVTKAARGCYTRNIERQAKFRPPGAELERTWDELSTLEQNQFREVALPYVWDAHRDVASQAWIECAQWHEERLVRDGVPPLFDAAVYANPYQEVAE